MTALLIEGKKGKSEYSFWERMLSVQGLNDRVELCNAESYSCIPSVLRSLLDLQQFDKIVVCFDTTAKRVKVKKYLDETVSLLEEKNAFDQVILCSFYCFEDCILLFEQFEDWVYPKREFNPEKSKILREYQCLGTDITDTWGEQNELKNLLEFAEKVHIKRKDSRESLAGAVVRELTKNTHFQVDKGMVSECWTNTCEPPESCVPAKISCGLEHQPLMDLDKTLALMKNSVCVRNVISNLA